MERARNLIVVACLISVVAVVFAQRHGWSATQDPPADVHGYVAVLDLEVREGVSPSVAGPLTDAVIDGFLKSGKYKVVDRANRDAIFLEVGFQLQDCVDNAYRIRAGRVLGVGKIVTGSVSKLGETFIVALQMVNVETSEIEASGIDRCRSEVDALDGAATRAARRLLGLPVAESSAVTPGSGRFTGITSLVLGRLIVTTSPPGAQVYIDSVHKGPTPLRLEEVGPGPRRIVVIKEGYGQIQEVVTVESGRTTTFDRVLGRQTGKLSVTTAPAGAAVYMDDVRKGDTAAGKNPLVLAGLAPGSHRIRVELDHYHPLEQSVFVQPDGTESVTIRLTPLPVRLLVTSTPPGASVAFDGDPAGATPLTVELATGRHVATVTMAGWASQQREVMIEPGEPDTLCVTMEPIGSASSLSRAVFPDGTRGGAMILVPAGRFRMGCAGEKDSDCKPDEGPAREIDLPAFYIDQYAVTNQHFTEFVRQTGYQTEAEKTGSGYTWDRLKGAWVARSGFTWRHPFGLRPRQIVRVFHKKDPVTQVSWEDAEEYCGWCGKRLPAEAEWEKAARGGRTGEVYPWGDGAPARLLTNFADKEAHPYLAWADQSVLDGYKYAAPVGVFEPNGYGIYGMTGNIWEWCEDWYFEASYRSRASVNQKAPPAETKKVVRGGSWFNPLTDLRLSRRGAQEPHAPSNHLGFRCAMDGR